MLLFSGCLLLQYKIETVYINTTIETYWAYQREKKKEIGLSPMTKALTPTETSKNKRKS